jgi:hypothetical protein
MCRTCGILRMEIGPQTWSRLSQVPCLTLPFRLVCIYLRIQYGRSICSIYVVVYYGVRFGTVLYIPEVTVVVCCIVVVMCCVVVFVLELVYHQHRPVLYYPTRTAQSHRLTHTPTRATPTHIQRTLLRTIPSLRVLSPPTPPRIYDHETWANIESPQPISSITLH